MIQQNMLRFIIPFHLKNYQELKQSNYEILRTSGWTRSTVVSGENDLYEYITSLIAEDDYNSIGSAWEMDKERVIDSLYTTKVGDRYINWRLVKVGLILFDTEVGILWYEVENKAKFLSVDEMHEFAYIIKEFSYFSEHEKKNKNKPSSYKYFSDSKDKLGIKLEQLMIDPNVENVQEFNSKNGLTIKWCKKINLFLDVLSSFLNGLQIDSYFANRKTKDGQIIPDRGIPFSWILNSPELVSEHDAASNVFKLGRCYKKTYSMSGKINDTDFYNPFDDSIWYACLEGCGNYTYPKEEKEFYSSGYRGRLDSYFYMFILCVGQYYSLLQLEQEVAHLSTDEKKYSSQNNILEDMLDKIHIFNLKNKYSQVSHVTHQNEFYTYLKKRFNIEELHQELEVELQLLYEMIERKKSIRNAKRYKVISIISSIFVGVGLFGNINQIYDSFVAKEWDIVGQILFNFAFMGVVAGIGVIIWLAKSIVDRMMEKKEKRK